jgi:nitrite reductase/ring-hydroxylating ferredoxin subunit
MHHLLATKDLPPGKAYGFEIDIQPVIEGFLINRHGQIHAYQNACPHTGVTLNWAPHQFMDVSEQFIQCGLHGALFVPESGLCVRGPCLGQSLKRLSIRIIDEQIYLDTTQNS